MGIFWSVGTALSALVGWAVLPSVGWRVFFVASALPSLLLVLLWKHLPESPRYLVLNGRVPEAVALFQTIAKRNNIPLAPKIELVAAQDIESDVTSGSVSKILGGIRIINRRPHVADWAMLSKTLKLFLIWSSYYGLTFVTPKIARSVTGNESSVYLSSFITALQYLIHLFRYLSILLVTLAELPGLFLVNFGLYHTMICVSFSSVLHACWCSLEHAATCRPHATLLRRLCSSSTALDAASCNCFCSSAPAFHSSVSRAVLFQTARTIQIRAPKAATFFQ
jgi:hypothetical protein